MDVKEEIKEEKKEGPNLWNEFLANSLQGGRSKKEGHLVIFGSANCGKTALVSCFKKLESRSGDMKRFLMMRYSYVYLTSSDSDDAYALLNIWQIAEEAHAMILDTVIPESQMENVSYMICLDVSKPSQVQSEYQKWIRVLETTQTRMLERCNPSKREQLISKLYKHIQFYVNPKDSEEIKEDEKEEVVEQRDSPEVNLGVPIVVVLTKVDAFTARFEAPSDAEDHFELLCAYIRKWCLVHGCASFSMAKGMKDQAKRILAYVNHRTFGTDYNHGPSPVVSLANLNAKFLFIPSGFDSLDTLLVQNPSRDLEADFAEHFKGKAKKEARMKTKPATLADDDHKFLEKLKVHQPHAALHATHSGTGAPNGQASGAAVATFFNKLLDKNKAQTAEKPS